jgi:predicted phosphoadenosine phosphosulfate sulfurtransferase
VSRRNFQPSIHVMLPGTVLDAALNRIRWLWDEFDGNVFVATSGGKDSAVTIELALMVARERDALPLDAYWLDQECELASTVDYQRQLADRPEVNLTWYQVPFRLFNATNHQDAWANVWGEGEDWVRPKEPDAYTVNDFGEDRFKPLLNAIGQRHGGAMLTGMRKEESPMRSRGLTTGATYKWVTWVTKGLDHFKFHPIYDWSFGDVWKAIHDHGWPYNRAYDHQFQYGTSLRDMRVSNYHHETALKTLWWLQEVEPDTWAKAVERHAGLNTAGHLREDFQVHRLPFMFRSWAEYHDYLLENLVGDPADRAQFRKLHAQLLRRLPYVDPEECSKAAVQGVIANDFTGTKLSSWTITRQDRTRTAAIREARQAGEEPPLWATTPAK